MIKTILSAGLSDLPFNPSHENTFKWKQKKNKMKKRVSGDNDNKTLNFFLFKFH